MADALTIGARQSRWIRAAPTGVSGVEQQVHRRLGVGHEGVDVALRLDDRAHVMMVAERESLSGELLREFGHLCSEVSPVALAEPWTLRQRTRTIAVDAVRYFGDDDDVRARALRHGDMGPRSLEFVAGGTLEQFGRIPTADEYHSVFGQLVLQREPVGWHLVALLHAGDARFPCLGKAGFKRRIAADLLQVVVGPTDWVGADANGHFQSPMLPRQCCDECLAA